MSFLRKRKIIKSETSLIGGVSKYLYAAAFCVPFVVMPSLTGALADDAVDCPGHFCPLPQQMGQQALDSNVVVHRGDDVPPSAEYRRPADEVLYIPALPTGAPSEHDNIKPFSSGQHVLTKDELKQLQEITKRLEGKALERVDIIGHADMQHLSEQSRQEYQDNQQLSVRRAQETQTYLHSIAGWEKVPMFASGVGLKDSAALCKVGTSKYKECLAPNRRVELRIWYAEPASACQSMQAAEAAAPFRISVDGAPLNPQDRANSADVSRCTDVALAKADIQVRYDGLQAEPALNVNAWPDAAVRGENVIFTPYSNYMAFIEKAEVRIFAPNESLQKEPIAVIPLDKDLSSGVNWAALKDPRYLSVNYVLRVYDKEGRFDETAPKSLRLLEHAKPIGDEQSAEREKLIGYGENHRDIKNIAVKGAAITVNGTQLNPDTKVWAMGQLVPVDPNGKFAFRQIVPTGDHQVTVVTQEKDGRRSEYNRSFLIPQNDWFYVAMGDLTVGENTVSGPAKLLSPNNASEYRTGTFVDGQAAFYAKGKVDDDYVVTSSVDTKGQPIANSFSNFSSKDPQFLLRRIDPNNYYTVYGDDSTTVEDAPTQGKFFVKVARGDSSVMWGNFQTSITGTDLINYNRTLYGANGVYKSDDATKFGERRTDVNGFVADPGTLGALEEFRGTGGSLYYLRNQDVVVGSEQLRVEVRDQDSGIVLQSTQLVFGQDYEIDYIQGRIILTQALSSTSTTNTLVRTGSSSGNPAYLVANYEYEPTTSQISNWTKGGRASQWINDYFRVGVTGYQQSGAGTEQNMTGVDTTVRYAPGTYVKLESGRTVGAGAGALSSVNGGYNFAAIPQTVSPNVTAYAYRAETGIDFREITESFAGKANAYFLHRDNGYSAPGELTNEGMTQVGATAVAPVDDRLNLNGKLDSKQADLSGATKTAEVGGDYKVSLEDTVFLATRYDYRQTGLAAGNSSILAQTGTRVDEALKFLHAPVSESGNKKDYEVYGLVQDTLSRDGDRSANNRYGMGGRYEVTDRITLTGEATDGSGGWGGKAGEEYRESDRTSYYTNYEIDNGRTDTGLSGPNSTLAFGTRTRYSDSLSAFGEQRTQDVSGGQSSLTHSFGLDYAASDHWTWGGRMEHGTVSDPTAGDFVRTALSINPGYHNDKTKYGGTIEWRDEEGRVLGHRTSWLMKNTLGYQTTQDWRFLGGLDVARSQDGLTSGLNANFTEGKIGYAYRPVDNDRFNMLVKYTYLDDLSSPGQLSPTQSVMAGAYQQRSQVFDIDGLYDLTPKLGVGGKFGYRLGQLKDTTAASPQWFSSQAYLGIARADYHVLYEWDVLGEFRYLNAQEAKDAKYGTLVGVYRHVDENIKVGLGYNFSAFTDDLTNLNYHSQGFFINGLSKF